VDDVTSAPSFDDIGRAAGRIGKYVHRTPVMRSHTLDEAVGARVFFKCENLQKAGSFKIRGATNAVFSLDDKDAARGVAGTSSGNHAQALALAARWRGIPATVVMHDNAPKVKTDAVRWYGASVVPVAPDEDARNEALDEVVEQTGAVIIPPYDDERVIAGAGTAALELIEEVPGLDVVIGPVGGGGLMSGTSLAAFGADEEIRVFGAEPAGADDAYRSLHSGELIRSSEPDTVADGLLTSLSERTFAILSDHLRDIITVTDTEIIEAMRLIWTRMKLVVEPSGAVAVAAAIKADLEAERVGVILSGGNADVDNLPW
jgi:threonine dehydratase